MFYLLVIFGTVIRFLLVGVPGFKADVAFWKGWGLAVADKGIIWLANNTNYNYPPGFAYVLYLINKIYALFADPYNINQYWLDNNFFYLFLIKIITILADISIIYLIIKIAGKLKTRWGKLLALFYFLNIVTLFDGVVWGQVDQYGLFLFMVSIYFLILEKPNWASVFFVISFLMKFQNIIFIPIFYLYIYKKYSFTGMIRALQLGFLSFVVIILPFWWGRQMASLLRLFTINSDWFPWYSLNAFNLWWIASGLEGMKLSDKTLVFGLLNAKQIGLLFFSFIYFIATLNVFFAKKEELIKEFILSTVLVVFAFFHLLTQSHERYLFPLLGLVPLLYLVKKETSIRRLLIFLLLLTVGMFLNMYLSAAMNYPDQVFWPFAEKITRSFSLYVSIYQIGLFVYFLIQYFSGWIVKNRSYVVWGLLLVAAAMLIKNQKYLFRKPISLTEIQPITWSQEYLEPVINMTVESARGVFFWNRLSENYYFYNKGIGSHADSAISYGLRGRFSELTTDFGIDTEGDSSAKALFIIEGDGRVLFKSKAQGRFDLPGRAKISIKGVKVLTLKIIKGGESNYGVHADWLDPVLLR